MSVVIVIVNYRTPAITLDCLGSLEACDIASSGDKVVLVENGSRDDSARRIRDAIEQQGWNAWITLLESVENLGFAGGNNLGIRWSLKNLPAVQYVLLLNSDTLVPADVLRACQTVMEADRTIGMMSCRLTSADGSLQTVTREFPTPLRQTVCALGLPWRWPKLFGWANFSEVSPHRLLEASDCDWIGGAFMFIRRSALEEVGLLDRSFFFYGEDIEFCFRFRRAGYRVHYDPSASITHLGGGSSDPTRLASASRNRHAWQARYLVQRKCYGSLAAWWLRAVDIAMFGLRKLLLVCKGQREGDKYRDTSATLGMLLQRLDVKT